MIPLNEREGKITYGGTVVRLRLADTANPYRPIRQAVWTPDERIPGGEGSNPNRFIRRWSMSNWERGELGEAASPTKWSDGGYRYSASVRPTALGDALVLSAQGSTTVNEAAADFTDGVKLVRAHGKIYACDDASVHLWDPADEDWATTGWGTGATTQTVTSMADFGDGTDLLIGYDDKSIRRVDSGANSEHFAAAGASFNPELRSFQGIVYYLDGPNLYELSTAATDTRTALSTPGDRVTNYMSSGGNVYRRMCVTDTGVAWVNPDDDGNCTVYEYNAKNQTDFASGALPPNSFPYSTWFHAGFIFVAYRDATGHDQDGAARIYYQRGGQRGTTPKIRTPDNSNVGTSKPIILCGVLADDLIFYYAGALMAYDLSAGAVFMIGGYNGTTDPKDGATFGKSIFVTDIPTDTKVVRWDLTSYTLSSGAALYTGRHDFGLPDVKKTLYTVSITHDPLPASTQITLDVSADGKTFAAVTGTDSTDNDTSFTWTVSTSSSQVTGQDFELKIEPLTTDATKTPTIRSITAEAGPAEKRRGIELDLDVAGTATVGSAASTQLLSQLLAAAEYTGGLVKLTDVWGVADDEVPTDREVMVEVLAGAGDRGVATARFWEVGSI